MRILHFSDVHLSKDKKAAVEMLRDRMIEKLISINSSASNKIELNENGKLMLEALEDVLEEVYGNTEKLYFFFDEEFPKLRAERYSHRLFRSCYCQGCQGCWTSIGS